MCAPFGRDPVKRVPDRPPKDKWVRQKVLRRRREGEKGEIKTTRASYDRCFSRRRTRQFFATGEEDE